MLWRRCQCSPFLSVGGRREHIWHGEGMLAIQLFLCRPRRLPPPRCPEGWSGGGWHSAWYAHTMAVRACVSLRLPRGVPVGSLVLTLFCIYPLLVILQLWLSFCNFMNENFWKYKRMDLYPSEGRTNQSTHGGNRKPTMCLLGQNAPVPTNWTTSQPQPPLEWKYNCYGIAWALSRAHTSVRSSSLIRLYGRIDTFGISQIRNSRVATPMWPI